ncbi:hypothetical protein DL769_007703 [Monosporascus sp. CRB-8-3]|nr:hypothetical protein DL769_007703 [Monosporascus sp. CRB-8-3]
MRGQFTIFSALLCGLQGRFVTGLGSNNQESEGLFQPYEAEFNNVESVCFTYLTTYLVQVEPTPGPGSEPEDPGVTGSSTTTTVGYTGSVVRTATEGFSVTVETPYSYTTTTQFTGTVLTTSTAYPTRPGDIGTVFIKAPFFFTTTTTPYTGTATTVTTQFPSGPGGTATVDIYNYTIPDRYDGEVVTTTTQYPTGTERTGTVFIKVPTGSAAGRNNARDCYRLNAYPKSNTWLCTVIVQVPYGATTTYTTQYNGSVTTTTIQFPTGTDATVTVVVQTPLPTLSCDPFGYLIQNTSLYRVNITSGDLTLIRDVVGDGRFLQAIGYSVADNYLYGTIGGLNNTPVFLIRIAANGDSTILNELILPYRVNTGDVDEQSRYWITYNGTNITQVDVRPSSPTFGQLIGTTRRAATLPANNATIYDWAYVPGRGNYLWSLGQSPALNSTTLQRFNRGTYNWEFVRDFGNIAGVNWWGAIYASADGFLYATENSSGQIWRFPLDIGDSPTRFSTANPTRENDGARCIRAQDLPEQPYTTSPPGRR